MNAHSLIRLQESLYNNPQLITPEAFDPILAYLSTRNNPDFLFKPSNQDVAPKKTTMIGDIGEVSVSGALTYKPINAMCGDVGSSYQGILEQSAELIANGVTKLVTVHDSGGGQASHCFDTANQLRTMCDEAGIKWYAYIDTYSASASLALGIAADEVIAHPDSSTGSIGCVSCLLDKSKAYDMAGIKPIYISSTDGKTPFKADGSFSESFLNKMQEDVTRLGMQFANHVNKYSGIPVEDILAMDAQMFHAEEALSRGLVNKIMTHQQFLEYLKSQ